MLIFQILKFQGHFNMLSSISKEHASYVHLFSLVQILFNLVLQGTPQLARPV